MWEAIPVILDEFEKDPAIRVIVVTRRGRQGVRVGRRHLGIREGAQHARAGRLLRQDRRGANMRLNRCSKPTIARIRGYCIGGGMAVSLLCDIRIASDNSKFGVPAARLGLGYRAAASRS
jgi:enoyl-CoA hydratase/carnithine racemase